MQIQERRRGVFEGVFEYSSSFLILNGINRCFDVSIQVQESMSVSIAARLDE